MNCIACKQPNAPERNYCGGCGTPLARYCSLCGFRNGLADRFCGGCGADLGDGKGEASLRRGATAAPSDPAAAPAGLGAASLRRAAGAKGFRDLRFDGLRKALAGITSLEEVLRATRISD